MVSARGIDYDGPVRSDDAHHAPERTPEEASSVDASADSVSDQERGVTAQRLAALALASDDDDLAELQGSGFAPERTPSLDRLRLARRLVTVIGRALESNTADAWKALAAAVGATRQRADDALTDRDPEPGGRAAQDMGLRSTDLPPPPPIEATVRGPALVAANVPEETMISPAPVAEMIAAVERSEDLAEHTLVEAGLIEGAVERARELIDASATPPPGAARSEGPPSSAEGGTVQLSYSSLAHGFALTVEEYAALCAQRDADPPRLRAVRARYGIPEARGHEAIDRYFEQVFVRDPSMRALWERHYRHYAALADERRF